MTPSANGARSDGRRRAVLDLAPLERECMQALWPLGEGTVRQIRDLLAATRPRAYTTIMTILDRLAQKGVVTRQKVRRAYLYRPNFSAEEARAHAVQQLVEHFFAGSREALQAHLSSHAVPIKLAGRAPRPPQRTRRAESVPRSPAAPAPPARLDESLL